MKYEHQQILNLKNAGYRQKEIAEELDIKVPHIKYVLGLIKKKG